MMKNITEQDILHQMRNEWAEKVKRLSEDVDMVLNAKTGDGDKKMPVLSPDLKVMHKKSGIRYTIVSVGPHDVILKTPEEDTFLVDQAEFEDSYRLD